MQASAYTLALCAWRALGWQGTAIHREATVLISQHPFGVSSLMHAPPDNGAQNASAQGGLCLSHQNLVDSIGRMEDYPWRRGFSIGVSVARHFLNHAIDHTDVTTKLQCRLTCTQVMSELARWREATAPMCSAALSTWAASVMWVCKLCAMNRGEVRSTMFRADPSRRMK